MAEYLCHRASPLYDVAYMNRSSEHTKKSHYYCGDHRVDFALEGQQEQGPPVVLLDGDDDMTALTPWHRQGFTVAPFLSKQPTHTLQLGIRQKVQHIVERVVGPIDSDFRLEKYHHYVNDTSHAAVVEAIRHGFLHDTFPIAISEVAHRISEVVGFPLQTENPPYDVARYGIRITRPNVIVDNNPPHRDVYLPRLCNGINLYIPIAGSTKDSALGVLPGSHRVPESSVQRTRSGATINGIRFTVPCIVDVNGPVRLIRPNPKPDEVLIFSPYLIHGGGFNGNDDTTRVSIEIRLWRDAHNSNHR